MDATRIIGDAIKAFESNIYDVDAKELDSLSVRDVLDSARTIEREREERQSLCNLRRVEALLKELRRLAEAARKLQQSSCPEHYLWGPVKLAVEIANEDDEALEAVLSGYARLTSGLRFLVKIVAIPRPSSSLHEVIAYTVSDVLDFHGRIYQALRKGGWRILFNVSWAELAPVFDCIVERLEHNSSLVDRAITGSSNVFGEINVSGNATAQLGDRFFEIEHATFAPPEDFLAAREFREKVLENLRAKQKRRAEHQLLECIEWLDPQSRDRDQANLFSRCSDAREEATCEWILSHSKIRSWLDPDSKKVFLWLKGKPGKTTLATYIIEYAKLPAGGLMLYYLCSHESQPLHDIVNTLLSVLATQILRSKRHLVPYVFETYVKNAEQPALKLPVLLRQLFTCLPTTYIVIDGLNECDSDTQSRIIGKLDSITANRRNENTAGPEVRILISSQEAKGVPHKLLKQPSISLTEEHAFVSHDIKAYTMNTINSLEDRFDQRVVEEIASLIMAKANGMFLWVKLVLLTLLEQESLFEIRTTLERLPTGLAGIYKVLLRRLEHLADSRQKPRIRMIFYWMLFALRPLKAWEICDALVIGGSNLVLVKDHTVLHPRILDICKPFIEVHKDHTVSFVHFSVKDYLLDADSGPFVLQRDALTHITSACFKYLFTCEDFFSAKYTIDTYRQIVFQHHSLFPYVAEAWKNHFTALAADLPIPANETEIVISNLLANPTDPKDQYENSPSRQQDQQSTAPRNPARIRTDREVVRFSILQAFRDAPLGSESSEHFMSSNEDRHDYVKQAFICFQVQFEQLLRGQCPYSISELGVSQADLDLLRNRYATAAFLCRRGQCQCSILGFSNVEERARHERSHEKQFCCLELGCDFQDIGFASRAALRNHVQRYHKRQEDTTVPKLVLNEREAAKGGRKQIWRCCTCQRKSGTLAKTRCEYPDCLHEYCSDCSITTTLPQSRDGRTPVSDTTKITPSFLDYITRGLSPSSAPLRTGLQMLSDAAIANQRCDPYSGGRSQGQQLQGQQAWQHQQNAVHSPTVPESAGMTLLHTFYHLSAVLCIGFSPDGRHIATSCDSDLQIFDLETGFKVCDPDDGEPRSPVSCLCYSPDGTSLATGYKDGVVRIRNVEGRQIQSRFVFERMVASRVWSLEFFHNGDYFACVSGTMLVTIWNVINGSAAKEFMANHILTSVAVSFGDQYIAAGSIQSDRVYIWHVDSGKLCKRHPGSSQHKGGVHGVAFSSCGGRVASCGTDGTIKIWNISVSSRQSDAFEYGCIKTFEGHTRPVSSVCFAQNDGQVMSGSLDKSIRFWDSPLKWGAAGSCSAMAVHEDYVTCVAYSQTSDLFASGSADMQVRVWRYDKPPSKSDSELSP